MLDQKFGGSVRKELLKVESKSGKIQIQKKDFRSKILSLYISVLPADQINPFDFLNFLTARSAATKSKKNTEHSIYVNQFPTLHYTATVHNCSISAQNTSPIHYYHYKLQHTTFTFLYINVSTPTFSQ